MRICDNSRFIFIITSKGKLEDRFLYDIGLGVNLLISQGVSTNNITVVSDMMPLLLVAKCSIMSGVSFVDSSNLMGVIENADCENLFIISNCHGSIDGIDAVSPIKPYALTNAIKSNKYASNVLVVFGQCFAGVFNFMDVRDAKNIVYIGATDIDASFSCQIDKFKWPVNISVLAFFQWLSNPYDVDGDGLYSVADLYKYMAWYTNTVTNDIEKQQTSMLIDAKVKLESMRSASTTPISKLEQDAIDTINNYTIAHQKTWILNAIAAGQMHFS